MEEHSSEEVLQSYECQNRSIFKALVSAGVTFSGCYFAQKFILGNSPLFNKSKVIGSSALLALISGYLIFDANLMECRKSIKLEKDTRERIGKRICRAPRNIYFKGQVFGFHYKYAVHNFFKVNFSSTVNNEGFRDVLFDLNLYEDVESEAQKYKELLSRYCLYDISTTQNIFFVHPYLNTTDEEKVNDRKELEEESVQLLQTLKWEVPGRIALPVQSLSRKVVFQYNQIKQIRECILRDTSVKYAGIFINKDTLFYGHRIELQRELFDLNVFDRYSVVLQIFKQHAQTREAKLQVSLAEIPYVRHRLRGDHALELENKHSKSRQGESYFHHHMMELKKRENKIKKELCRLKEQRSYLRRSRFKLGLPSIAVVGYTNSGKTSLIKSLTGSDKLTPEDKFFATLDVTLHGGYLPQSHQKVLYIDTVGFISDIPVNLIASFASTLEDALHADLLIHVRDISHPDHERQNKNEFFICFFCIISILIQTLLRFYHQSTGILDINNLGIGWYSGLIFGVTGGIGIYVSRHMTKCSLATFLVLCVLSSIMCLPLLLIAVIGYEQFKTAHASFITYLLPLQIVVSILEAIISIISSCISCHGTCCAHSPLVKPNCECKQISQNDKLV
ncbi:GTPase HflX,Putative GTP-binding protein 6 [Lepeophtheirus salmonis]|uniref:GTPase HflX,Putative GTP-binding protein 6 n=1 Tax=Lepeophtheirus salmonis TaxID=72036 RepID=A0A7R8D207_LEPSM|nr:GTPase HflX,Putative GTP-binding protein 6 [Lepeophtheirus salmonis]CAF3000991.1 GTPase HflX,Putative GTP-binding protein 6 [Lepeophtheirus salmonis]